MEGTKEKDESKLKLAIDELRQTYDHLQNRDNAVESKASTFIGFGAVVITIILFAFSSIISDPITEFSGLTGLLKLILIPSIIADLVIFIESVYKLKKVIDIRDYDYPFVADPQEISDKVKLSYIELQEYIIEDYREIIPHYTCIVETKVNFLRDGIEELKGGFVLSLIILLIIIFIKMIF